MNQDTVSLMLDAKKEYNKHLVSIFKKHIITTLKKLYNGAEELCFQENSPENILMVFQDNLSKIAKWSPAKLNAEYNDLKKQSGCNWLDDLIKVIYITNIKIMTMLNKVKKDAKIKINVPAGGQFYHLCLLEVARQIWKQPFLFAKGTSYSSNMASIDKIINDAIVDVQRQQMPVKTLIQEYIDTDNIEDIQPIPAPQSTGAEPTATTGAEPKPSAEPPATIGAGELSKPANNNISNKLTSILKEHGSKKQKLNKLASTIAGTITPPINNGREGFKNVSSQNLNKPLEPAQPAPQNNLASKTPNKLVSKTNKLPAKLGSKIAALLAKSAPETPEYLEKDPLKDMVNLDDLEPVPNTNFSPDNITNNLQSQSDVGELSAGSTASSNNVQPTAVPLTSNSRPLGVGLELDGTPMPLHWASNPVQTVQLIGEQLATISTEPAENNLAGTESEQNLPAGTEPVENLPAGAEPEQNLPAGAEPEQNLPAGTEPVENTLAGDEPAENTLAGAEPEQNLPAEIEPAENNIAENLPAGIEPAENNIAENLPAGAEPEQNLPARTEPARTEPARTEPAVSVEIISNVPPQQTVQQAVETEAIINKKSNQGLLASLLNPDELADLDIDLEELSIDNMLEEKKVMKPIKVAKPGKFVFFKHAPAYPGH